MSQQGQQGMYNPGGYNMQGNQPHMNSMPQQQQQPQDFMRGSMGGMQMPGMGQFQGGGAGGNFNGGFGGQGMPGGGGMSQQQMHGGGQYGGGGYGSSHMGSGGMMGGGGQHGGGMSGNSYGYGGQQQPQQQQFNPRGSFSRMPSNSSANMNGGGMGGQSMSNSQHHHRMGGGGDNGGGPMQMNFGGSRGNMPSNSSAPNQQMLMQQQRGRPGGGGPYSQEFLPNGLNGDWQSDNDMHHRRDMIQHIVKLLKQKDKNASPEWLTKLPQMVKQLEVSLYRSAPSFEAYSDISTLKSRLQQLAMEIAKKTQQAKDGSSSGAPPMRQQQGSRLGPPPPQAPPPMGMSHQQQQGPSMGGSNGMPQQGGPQQGGIPPRQQMPPPSDVATASSSSSKKQKSGGGEAVSSQHGNPSDPGWKMRIRHKQQRLLLLHHSSKCPYEDGKCKVTPYCGEMKKLWKHMARCTDNECRVPHCFSSRSILSHYRKCKDPMCPACRPVRETVRKTQKGSRGMGGGARGSGSGGSGGIDGPGSIPSGGSGAMIGGIFDSGNCVPAPPDTSKGGMGPPQVPNGMNNGMDSSMEYPPPPAHHSGNMAMEHQMPNGMKGGMPGPMMSNGDPNGMVGSMGPPLPQPLSSSDQGHLLQSSARGDATSSSGAAKSSSGGRRQPSSSSNPEQGDAKARHKRQRLLLLRHASKCTAAPGTCQVTPHCAEMKKLWKHIASCKDSYCKVRHCMSSRYVLSHYRRCKPPCTICDPVKAIIKNGFKGGIEVDPDTMADDTDSRQGGVRKTPPPDESSSSDKQRRKKQKTDHAAPAHDNVCTPAPPQSTLKPDVSRAGNSLLECFSTDQIKTHILSLKRFAKLSPSELKSKCGEILKSLQNHENGWVFSTPVNPVELGLDDYFDIIKKPMDLGTIGKKLEQGSYHSFDEFKSDVRLTFENAMKYNEEQTVVHEMAKGFKKKFDEDYKKMLKSLDKEHAENSKKAHACGLCGCEKLNFEPPIYFCSGPNCQTKRIRRNTHYYITADKQYSYCNQCFGEIKGDHIDLGTTKIKKSDLAKRKNDEIHEESWVQCDDCERWIHQICGLYNTRHDKDNTSAYSCPKCVLQKRKRAGKDPDPLPTPPSASDIPRTKLSEWLEGHVHKKVEERMNMLAREKADTENVSYSAAYKELSAGGPVTIRQVTSTDRKHEVRELMKERYADKNYPDEFLYRGKCIVVFQNIDGVDVVLFALYVYEHGDDNPLPNKKTVYVSYLDSVHFMKPRKMRTFIYHEILISYLDYARAKGFQQAFIWACPPLKGDDYIFYAKPEDQRIPKEHRLRQWYVDMLEECQRRDIVGKVTNMYDEYLNDPNLDFSAVPYFDGDYFPGEAENIIKQINDDVKKSGKKGKSKSAKKDGKSEGIEYKDPVMEKFCECISGMKDSFMVAFLNCKGAKAENLVVPKEVMEWREANKESLAPLIEMSSESADATKENNAVGSKEGEGKKDKSENAARKALLGYGDNSCVPVKSGKGKHIQILDDDADEIDSEFFNTRQDFLDLCRGNHYQFDDLRRAKHTSMMVLWHLQNREAPKFVQQCFSCNREISSGIRHHCPVCPDFDLCHECFRSPDVNRGTCNHDLEAIRVDTSSSQQGLTAEQRKERQRNIQLHIALIEHASKCDGTNCASTNCKKMKTYLKHSSTCKVKATGGCKICKRIWTLLRIHAQHCKRTDCPIPQCNLIRKRYRQLQLKQRAMDDRRRQEMNRTNRMTSSNA